MARKRRSGRKSKVMNVAKTLVAGNAIFQMLEPSVRAGAVQAIQSGDIPAIIQAFRTGAKEAVSGKNLMEAFVPILGYGAAKKIAQAIGVRSPRVGKVVAF